MPDDRRPARLFAAAGSLGGVGLGVPPFVDPYRWARAFRGPGEPEIAAWVAMAAGARRCAPGRP